MFLSYRDNFDEVHRRVIEKWDIPTLIQQEDLLSKIIDSDYATDFILLDEVILLHDMVRDECIKRLAFFTT